MGEKAKNAIMVSKQLIVKKYLDTHRKSREQVIENLGNAFIWNELKPLPEWILEEVPNDICLFPRKYDYNFFSELAGVGLKENTKRSLMMTKHCV